MNKPLCNYAIACVMIIFLSSCAITKPPSYKVKDVVYTKLSPNDVIKRITRWCVENEFTIKIKQEDFLEAQSDLKKIQGLESDLMNGLTAKLRVADCGGGGMNRPFYSSNGSLTVLCSSEKDGTTKVLIKFKAQPEYGTTAEYCSSMGVIEKMLEEELVK